MNNNNNNLATQELDILEILSFMIQLKNIEWDEKQNKYIHSVILNINDEIAKLHEENDIIMKQNDEILKKLDN